MENVSSTRSSAEFKVKKGRIPLFLPNQESNLSERTKLHGSQRPDRAASSIFGTRNELFVNCALLNLMNGAIKAEVYSGACLCVFSSLNADRGICVSAGRDACAAGGVMPHTGGGTNSREQLHVFSPFIFHRIII